MVRIFFMFLISGPSLLYVFKKWSEFTLKVVRVYLKSGPSLLVFVVLPGNTSNLGPGKLGYNLVQPKPFAITNLYRCSRACLHLTTCSLRHRSRTWYRLYIGDSHTHLLKSIGLNNTIVLIFTQ